MTVLRVFISSKHLLNVVRKRKEIEFKVFKTEFARGPGRGDTCHLSNLDETLPD